MIYRDTRQALRSLTAVAATQGGYFTARQAAAAGYDYPHLSYHVEHGNFERADRGLYRLPTIPPGEYDDLIRLSLWSRGRDGLPQGVVSHESALALHDIGDVLPGRVHLTVPPSFRRHPPPNCVLHKGVLGPEDRAEWTVFSVTTPLRTLIDASTSDGVATEQLQVAIRDALEKGLVIRGRLQAAADGLGATSRLRTALEVMN